MWLWFFFKALDEGDIALLKTYVSMAFKPRHQASVKEMIPQWVNVLLAVHHQGQSTYSRQIKQVEDDIQQLLKKINELTGERRIQKYICATAGQ